MYASVKSPKVIMREALVDSGVSEEQARAAADEVDARLARCLANLSGPEAMYVIVYEGSSLGWGHSKTGNEAPA